MSAVPRHAKAARFARDGLFRDAQSFKELERRIEELPTELERGDAFEVFVEAYLNLSEITLAEEVWVVGKVPPQIRTQLNLPSRDYGYDGVVKTRLGEFVAYQAKFRSQRVSIPYAELATFFGIAEKTDARLVLTNSVAISTVAESRTSFISARGTDFDRLDVTQLNNIAAWLEGVPTASPARAPRPHQRNALADIKQELEVSDRATVVMACGTGKTLVGLWSAEQLKSQKVLVLLPSLSLLRQTLHEWARWNTWGERFRYLCVCSDQNVSAAVDEITFLPQDVDFRVRTDPAIVREFLSSSDPSATSVVFTTYQSAPVVGQALMGLSPFDLGIFDEAHKTVGLGTSRFAYALTDAKLPIQKRLFFTATPRRFNIRKRDAQGDFAVASMNDQSLYGRVAHRLTFSEAVALKIIVPYKVVISVVDSDMIDNAIINKSDVTVEDELVRSKWVAHQLALKKAVENYDVKRIITFHSRVSAAAKFSSDGAEGIRFHLPKFHRFHVSGIQPTAQRDETLREFASAQFGLVSNARCLTEGVDVPSVDMVAFMNPRRSRVDIVQAVGRAMRISGDKKDCGYVLVPLFLDVRNGETLDEALSRSDYQEVADVLSAMRDNDDEFEELISAVATEKGRSGRLDISKLSDAIHVVGSHINLEALTNSVMTAVVEELSFKWDGLFGRLLAFNERFGIADVPAQWSDDPQLAIWCVAQKVAKKNNVLSSERQAKLEQINFAWSRPNAWDEKYLALIAYKSFHGDCNIDLEWQSTTDLFDWCQEQKKLYATDALSVEKVRKLRDIGLVVEPPRSARYRALREAINSRSGPFSLGVFTSPFVGLSRGMMAIAENEIPEGTVYPWPVVWNELKAAGWVDCGRLSSRDFTTKKQIICAPELTLIAKTDLRRMAEGYRRPEGSELLAKETSDLLRMITETSGADEFDMAGLSELLVKAIRERQGLFAQGIVASPFHWFCRQFAESLGLKIEISQKALLDALNTAGWVDRGRLASREFQTKKPLFCAPELKKTRAVDLRRLVERVGIEAVSRPVSQPVLSLTDNGNFLVKAIRECQGAFAQGVIGSPLHQICSQIAESLVPSIAISKTALLNALSIAGWVNCGKLATRDFPTKKQIFCAPELLHTPKSTLRRMVENQIKIDVSSMQAFHLTPSAILESVSPLTDSGNFLVKAIRERQGLFAQGIVASPFQRFCTELPESLGLNIAIPPKALLNALKLAGWVDRGRVSSRDLPTKKQIICAPELVRAPLSELRRMAG